MSRIDDDLEFMPSVYDRLLDLEPSNTTDNDPTENYLNRQRAVELKESLRRDLADLLNTRWACRSWPPDFDQLESSIMNYGIPDFTGVNMASPENREYLMKAVENAIKIFEPRLISFSIGKEEPGIDRRLHFQIVGFLHAEPYPEEVLFDASLKVQSSEFEIARK